MAQCSPPFLSQADFPSTGGDVAGRYCANTTHNGEPVSCCLTCPIADWVYSDSFPSRTRIANYISILSLVLNSFLLLTFIVLPKEKGHRHYLSIGLVISLMIIAVAFIIPLGTNPDFCYNSITPNNLQTDRSCSVTGAFVEIGAMSAVVWILLRSMLTALRIMANFKRIELFRNIAIGCGTGIPLLFLAISLPITGVSYRLGNVCVPANPSALATWFAWLLIFASVSWIIQVVTILYCLWRFASSYVAGPTRASNSKGSNTTTDSATEVSGTPEAPRKIILSSRRRRRIAWRKVRSILLLQWRSIVMAFIVVNLTIYFGIVFIQQTAATQALTGGRGLTKIDLLWVACLIANNGDKNSCLGTAPGLGLSESRAVGTLILASFIGIIVFLLLVRGSMFIGWWTLIRNPRKFFRRPSLEGQDFYIVKGKGGEQEKKKEEPLSPLPIPPLSPASNT